MKFIKQLGGIILVSYLMLIPVSTNAAIVNGGFESGLTAWSSAGDALVDDGFFGGSFPTEGALQALVTTLSEAGDFTPGLSFDDAVPVADLEAFLGLSGELIGLDATEGSAIMQSFTGNAGDTLAFDWNFLTDDAGLSGDFAFVLIDGSLSMLADANSFLLGASSGFFLDETGYQSLAHTFGSTGLHTLAFGVVDAPDEIGASGLLIDNITLTPIPLPASLLLFVSGLMGLFVSLRKS